MDKDRFPGLANGWCRLDGPAGSQPLDAAIEATAAWARSGNIANAHGLFAAAAATDALVSETRQVCGELLGSVPDGVVFGPSMTALTMRFTAALTPSLGRGDEIVVTRLDHDANVRPWVLAAERAGATVRWVDPDPVTLHLDPRDVAAALSDRTRWVAVTATSNAVGSAPDVAAICAAARAAGARTYIDAVAAAPHRRIDRAGWGTDVVVCSAYKWYGPHVGVLAADPSVLAAMAPDKLIPSPDTDPERWELGTLPHELLTGVAAAARFMVDRVIPLDWKEEQRLGDRLDRELRAVPGITVLGERRPGDAPTRWFNLARWTAAELAGRLADDQIAVWHGNNYAWELAQLCGVGTEAAVRAGLVHYNDDDDVDRLIASVTAAAHERS